MRDYNVVIMGGGIAGQFLARHLRLSHPELSVLVLESAPKIDDYKVGESTVEVAAHYMIKRLNLGTYLYQHQLPKNGLRFFFDTPEKDLPLARMSEIGSDHMPYHPSFQLERAALERDLAVMNQASGAEVRLGAKVVDLTLGTGGAHHTVVFEQGGERSEARARWLVDAAGRRHLIVRKIGAKVHKESRLNTAAAWGRYRNVAGLDAAGDPAWRARVRWTSRHLSTNHMMYDGYWLWFIPLAGDLMSVGAVYDKDRIGNTARSKEAFEAFMRSHRSSRDLMEGAIFEDFQSYAHLPYYTDSSFFSEDRWALTGEAGAFTDPFYSPGSDFISTANEFIVSMIESDIAGDRDALRVKVKAYDAYYRFKYESTIRLYAKQYPVFGSYELYRLKYLLDFHNYYNLVVWPFMAERLTQVDSIEGELKVADRVLQALGAMGDHFSNVAARLRDRGEYHAHNAGRWANGLNGVIQLEKRLGPVLDDEFRRAQVDRAFGSVFAQLLERAGNVSGLAGREKVLAELNLPRVLLHKECGDAGVERLLHGVGGRIAKELRREFPGAPIEKVAVTKGANGNGDGNGSGQGEWSLRVESLDPSAPDHAKIVARAQELWDAKGYSLAHVAI